MQKGKFVISRFLALSVMALACMAASSTGHAAVHTPVHPPISALFQRNLVTTLYDCILDHAPSALLKGAPGSGVVLFMDDAGHAQQVRLRQPTPNALLNRTIVHAVKTCSLPPPHPGYNQHYFEVPIVLRWGSNVRQTRLRFAKTHRDFHQKLNRAVYLCILQGYSHQALLRGLSVNGQVSFLVVDGHARQVEMVQSTGDPVLDRGIMRSVRACALPRPPARYAKHRFKVHLSILVSAPSGRP